MSPLLRSSSRSSARSNSAPALARSWRSRSAARRQPSRMRIPGVDAEQAWRGSRSPRSGEYHACDEATPYPIAHGAIAGIARHRQNHAHYEDLPSNQGDFRHLTRLRSHSDGVRAFRSSPETPAGLAPSGVFCFPSSTMSPRTYDNLIATIPARRSRVRARPRSGSQPPFSRRWPASGESA